MERNIEQLQYISTNRQKTVPGLKVAYGNVASPFTSGEEPSEARTEKKSFFGRMKEAVINLVTEEAVNERPIGISQISRHTFQASEQAGRTIVRSGRPAQDYRFNQLIEPYR